MKWKRSSALTENFAPDYRAHGVRLGYVIDRDVDNKTGYRVFVRPLRPFGTAVGRGVDYSQPPVKLGEFSKLRDAKAAAEAYESRVSV